MYQSQVNMSTYGLDVALRYDLSRHLDGQPLQFMMKDRSVPNSPIMSSYILFGFGEISQSRVQETQDVRLSALYLCQNSALHLMHRVYGLMYSLLGF